MTHSPSHSALIEALKKSVSALNRQIDNIENWLETGGASTPEESKSIYNQMKTASMKAEKALKDE